MKSDVICLSISVLNASSQPLISGMNYKNAILSLLMLAETANTYLRHDTFCNIFISLKVGIHIIILGVNLHSDYDYLFVFSAKAMFLPVFMALSCSLLFPPSQG